MWEGGLHIALFAVCCFIGATAIPGGVALAAGWERKWYGPELLVHTPFTSYVVPGLILTLAVGGSAAWAAIIAWYNPEIGGMAAMIGGCIMMGWIVGEIYLLRQPISLGTLVELFYFCCGLAMLLLGLMLYQGG